MQKYANDDQSIADPAAQKHCADSKRQVIEIPSEIAVR